MKNLNFEREIIAGRLADRAGAFPGSKEWREAQALVGQLAAFDADHPEIVASLRAARAARTEDGVARALRCAD